MMITMTKMAECLYLLTLDLKFEIFFDFKLKSLKNFSTLINNINTTHISLITLTILIISTLSWLVLKTLKEGRKALTDMNKDKS